MRRQHVGVGQANRRRPSRQNAFKGVDRLFEAAGFNSFVGPQSCRTQDFIQPHSFVAEIGRSGLQPGRCTSRLKSKTYHHRSSRKQFRLWVPIGASYAQFDYQKEVHHTCGIVLPYVYGRRYRRGIRQAEEIYTRDSE